MRRLILLLLLATGSCFGDDSNGIANQVTVLRDLPKGDHVSSPVHFIIRSTFKGSVEFVESDVFEIHINTTAPSVDELARVQYNYSALEESALLQIHESDPVVVESPLKFIVLIIGGSTVMVFLFSIIFVCWWNVYRKPFIKETKIFNPDSSQAPLLVGKQVGGDQSQNGAGRVKKRKKKVRTKPMTTEEYMSSEEDTLDRHGTAVSPNRVPPYGVKTSPRKQVSFSENDSDLVATARRTEVPHNTPEGMTDVTDISRASTLDRATYDPNKPVVSYIKMQADGKPDPSYRMKKNQQGQYIPLSQSEGSGSDLDKQSTLKIRRDEPDYSTGTMPDVIRSRNRPVAAYNTGDPTLRRNGRYTQLSNEGVDSSDNEYNTMSKLSGAHIAHILTDHKGSPKFSHNTDRIPTTFGPPLPRPGDPQVGGRAGGGGDNLDQLELDSVGSSRSAGSSSGFKTQSDSFRSDSTDKCGSAGIQISDSDSAKSSGSTSTFPRATKVGEGATFNSKYFMQMHGTQKPNGHGDSTGTGQRQVDEAYGTMGSNNGNSTLRSNISTGSGSSSSVVTVISAPNVDDGSLSRRRQKGYPGMTPPAPPPPVMGGPKGPGGGPPGAGGSYGGGPGGPQKYRNYNAYYGYGSGLHMSIVCSLCLISLMTGVYCKITAETEVHIKVYAPHNFIRNNSEVYFNIGKDTQVKTTRKTSELKVLQYTVADSFVSDPLNKRCTMRSCEQGCDANTGKCICRSGFSISDINVFHCTDNDECKNAHDCSDYAQCFNTGGAYQCMCKDGYYGDGKKCDACNAPCKEGTFEVMPCADKQHPKLCKECSTSCVKEYYISEKCSPTHNIQCKGCLPRCPKDKYEYTPCHGEQNRQCRDVSELSDPKISSNIILENRQKAKQVFSYLLHQTQSTGPLTHMLELKRGSGFSVHITLKESNLAPLYQAVDHSDSNDNGGFYGDITITQQYCPFPVPEKYQLSLILHQGITTRAQFYNCQSLRREKRYTAEAARRKHKRETESNAENEVEEKAGEPEESGTTGGGGGGGNPEKRDTDSVCTKETGYYLDPHEPCETYSQFGRLPALNPEGWSVLCPKPGKLSDAFGISNDLSDLSTMFVDKTVRCAEARTNCDACLVMCSHTMKSREGSHRCNITGEDADNGESPRLQHCFSCCGKQDCAKGCEVYHNPECEPIRCVTGNLAEFVMSPVYSNRGTVFGCHIEAKSTYKIYDIDYTVLYNGKPVNSRVLKAQKLFNGKHPEKAIDEHNFLKVYYGSEVNGKPDFIEGDSAMKSFSAGSYMDVGMSVEDMDVTTRTLSVRPRKPFSVSSQIWKRQDCDTDVLKDLLLSSSSSDSDPYKPDPQISVQFVQKGQYRVFNRTSVPFIYFEVPKNKSVLRPLYDDTTVKDDDSLKAEIVRKDSHWILKVQGELKKCPGFFMVTVSDPAYPDQPMFEYDIGANCPEQFKLDFTIPTRGPDTIDKRFRVQIHDTFRTIHMNVFRPAPNISQETIDEVVAYESKGEVSMTVFTPVVAVMYVVVSCLALLLAFGFITETGKTPKKVDNKVHSQHLLFVVCYVTFRAAYSLAVTFTVLLLLIRFVNRDSINTIMEFHRYVETADNLQKLETGKIQEFVTAELQRQNQIANQTKVACEAKLQELQNTLEQAKRDLRVDDTEERLVSAVALQYTQKMILNLTNDVIKFKQEFTDYARKSVDRLTRSIVQTSSALEGNKWLAGAKNIYNTVQQKRSQQGQSTKPFMEWVGIQQEVERLAVDLSLENFPMPNLTEFLSLGTPNISSSQTHVPSILDVSLPRNQWYFQYENKLGTGQPIGQAASKQQRKVDTSKLMSWQTLLAILVVVDLIWFIHRMARSYSTAKMILYGVPFYIDCKKSADGRSPQRGGFERIGRRRSNNRCLSCLKDLTLRVMKTEFVPKLVATVTTCCALYLILKVSANLLTVKTLASVGYFDTLVAPVETSYRLARTRIKTNAYRVNKFEYPFYEDLVNVRTKRYQLMLEMYRDLQRSNNILHDSEFCAWKKLLNPNEKCNCTTAKSVKLQFEGCDLPPVTPRPYQKKNFSSQKQKLSAQMIPYINSARQVVMDTCHLVLVFVTLLVLVDILGSVIWIYLKRFNLLRLKPLFEIEQCPETTQS